MNPKDVHGVGLERKEPKKEDLVVGQILPPPSYPLRAPPYNFFIS